MLPAKSISKKRDVVYISFFIAITLAELFIHFITKRIQHIIYSSTYPPKQGIIIGRPWFATPEIPPAVFNF
jgi:hypothetical protein